MKLKTISLLSVVCFVILASCTSTPPSWMGNYREEYPSSDYIVQRGSGETVEFAKTNSLQAIAQYFQTTVNASMQSQLATMSQGDVYIEQRSTLTDIQVTSHIDLFGVEYTEPYFSKAEERWYILAYIHRETAWRQYSPKIENAQQEFHAIYSQVGRQANSFTEYQHYNRAWNKGKEFLNTLEFGRLLMDGIDSKYRDDRALIATLPATLQNKSQACSMRLVVHGDSEGIFTSAIKDVFSEMGFIVSENTGAYTIHLSISENEAYHEDLYAVFPVADITIKGNGNTTLYSLQHKGSRSVATTAAVAKRRGFKRTATEFAAKVKEAFNE